MHFWSFEYINVIRYSRVILFSLPNKQQLSSQIQSFYILCYAFSKSTVINCVPYSYFYSYFYIYILIQVSILKCKLCENVYDQYFPCGNFIHLFSYIRNTYICYFDCKPCLCFVCDIFIFIISQVKTAKFEGISNFYLVCDYLLLCRLYYNYNHYGLQNILSSKLAMCSVIIYTIIIINNQNGR